MHIRDSGNGIAPENLKKLFKRFGKLEEPDEVKAKNMEGIGLGLAICEAIVSQNEGNIEVHSKGLTHGSVFAFSMKMRTVPTDEIDTTRLLSDHQDPISGDSYSMLDEIYPEMDD